MLTPDRQCWECNSYLLWKGASVISCQPYDVEFFKTIYFLADADQDPRVLFVHHVLRVNGAADFEVRPAPHGLFKVITDNRVDGLNDVRRLSRQEYDDIDSPFFIQYDDRDIDTHKIKSMVAKALITGE